MNDGLRFTLCPFFQAHLLNQTQIEDLGVVPHFGIVTIGMKIIARKIRAVGTGLNTFLLSAWIYAARHWDMGAFSAFVSAAFARDLFRRDAQLFGHHLFQVWMIRCQIEEALETG